MKKNFYIVCNFTRNRNHQLAVIEEEYVNSILKDPRIKEKFKIKKLEILYGEGIIVSGERK